MKTYVAAIDQGTTSTRCMIFDRNACPVAVHQVEHEQRYPRPGWVEHDAAQIWENTKLVIRTAMQKAGLTASNIAAAGITNQRETTIIWDKNSGKPLHNALVWQDTRTGPLVDEMIKKHGSIDALRSRTGLPMATYFSAFKIKWLMENVAEIRAAVNAGSALFGTIDTWLAWNLTGGISGGKHVTDPTNASRTMLMDLAALHWDSGLCAEFGIPPDILPSIHPSSSIFGHTADDGPFGGSVPLSGIIGDQQAATVGQACLHEGDAKNTYGTGCFLNLNTGTKIVHSNHGLLTTVGYQFGAAPAVYALEGSVAIAGALVQWLRDNLKLIETSPQVEELARTVDDNGGIYFVPAFSGLYAPYWRNDARGVIVGMTRYVNRGHIARAALESTAFQVRDVLEAMTADTGGALKSLKVDGGMSRNELLMQFEADVLNVPIVRPRVTETTALGAAYAAGLAAGFWKNEQEIIDNWAEDRRWTPAQASRAGTELYTLWKKAVTRTFDWA